MTAPALSNGSVTLACPRCAAKLAAQPPRFTITSYQSGVTVAPDLACPSCGLTMRIVRGAVVKTGTITIPPGDAVRAGQAAVRNGAIVFAARDAGETPSEQAAEARAEGTAEGRRGNPVGEAVKEVARLGTKGLGQRSREDIVQVALRLGVEEPRKRTKKDLVEAVVEKARDLRRGGPRPVRNLTPERAARDAGIVLPEPAEEPPAEPPEPPVEEEPPVEPPEPPTPPPDPIVPPPPPPEPEPEPAPGPGKGKGPKEEKDEKETGRPKARKK